MEYIKFNKITYEQLSKIASYIKYQHIPKNETVFVRDKKAKKFFGVIRGTISLRTIDEQLIKEIKSKNNYGESTTEMNKLVQKNQLKKYF